MTSFFLFKPDGFNNKKEILSRYFDNSKLTSIHDFKITPAIFNCLYQNTIPPGKREAMRKYMDSGKCSFVECQYSIEEILTISGRHFLPELCDPNTIRFNYGQGIVISNSVEIVMNVIHRPKTIEQKIIQSRCIKEYLKI